MGTTHKFETQVDRYLLETKTYTWPMETGWWTIFVGSEDRSDGERAMTIERCSQRSTPSIVSDFVQEIKVFVEVERACGT